MKVSEISLTQGKKTIVDDDDFAFLNQWKWFAYTDGNNWYASRKEKGKNLPLHRVLMRNPKGKMVDHKNGNGLDNRKNNLRIVNAQENAMNRKVRSDNKIGEKNICWFKPAKLWRVQVRVKGKSVFCKYFRDLDAAIKARDEALIVFHKEFARI